MAAEDTDLAMPPSPGPSEERSPEVPIGPFSNRLEASLLERRHVPAGELGLNAAVGGTTGCQIRRWPA